MMENEGFMTKKFKDIKIGNEFRFQECEVLGLMRFKKTTKKQAVGIEDGASQSIQFRDDTEVEV